MVTSGVILLLFRWEFIDSILTVLIVALIVVGSCRLVFKVFRILLEGVPTGLDMYQLCSEIEDEEGVTLVHDVHAWTIATGYNALAAHVLVDPAHQGDIEPLMRRLRQTIREGFGIEHVTLQMEQSVTDCSENHHVGHLEARSRFEV